MAAIKRHHQKDCPGGTCGCPYRLDYRPLGTRGPRKRLFFPTKKAAEKYVAETSVKVTRGEYLDRSQVPTFAAIAEEWIKSSQKYLKFLDQCRLGDLIGRVAKDSKHAAGGLVGVDESWPINAEMPRPADGEVGVGFFNVDRLGIPIAG